MQGTQGKARKLEGKKLVGSYQRRYCAEIKDSVQRKVAKKSGQTKGIGKADRNRCVHMCGCTDEQTDRSAGKRGAAMTEAVTDQQEAAAPTTTSASKQLVVDNVSANRGSGKPTGERADMAIETACRSTAEGAAAANTSNLGEMNAPDLQSATHQEKKADVRLAQAQVAQNWQTRETGERSGVMMRTRRAKTGSNTDGESGRSNEQTETGTIGV